MKLTKRGEYALRALISLGLARETGRDLVRLGEIAEKDGIPEKFLEQIFQDLRNAGWVESVRGKKGGYRLAPGAGSVKIGDIVRVIEGPLAPIGCASVSAYEKCSCPDEAHCGLRLLMTDVRNAISGILDRYSLDQVVSVTVRHLTRDGINPGDLFSKSRPATGGLFQQLLGGDGI